MRGGSHPLVLKKEPSAMLLLKVYTFKASSGKGSICFLSNKATKCCIQLRAFMYMAFLVKKTIKQLEKWHENCPWVEQRTAPHRNNRITFLFEGNENSGKRHPWRQSRGSWFLKIYQVRGVEGLVSRDVLWANNKHCYMLTFSECTQQLSIGAWNAKPKYTLQNLLF